MAKLRTAQKSTNLREKWNQKYLNTDNYNLPPAVWMVIASFLFSCMGVFVKFTKNIPVYEVTFFRALINVLILLPWALTNSKLVAKWRTEPLPLFIRAVGGCSSVLLYFYALQHIHIADASMLNNSAPIVTLVLSVLFLKETISVRQILFVIVAFVGMALVLKPQSLFSGEHSTDILGRLAGFVSIFFAGTAYVAIKVATRSLHPKLIVFGFALLSTLFVSVPTFLSFTPLSLNQVLYILGVGVSASFAQEAMTRGYVGLPASVAAPLLMLTVVFSTFFGWFLWGELPDVWSFFGASLIAIGLVGSLVVKKRQTDARSCTH